MSHIKILIPTEMIMGELHLPAGKAGLTYKKQQKTDETNINKFQAFFHNKGMFEIFNARTKWLHTSSIL